MTNLDQLNYIFGVAGYAFAGLADNLLSDYLCGDTQKPLHNCQPTVIKNPFFGNPDVASNPDLFAKPEMYVADGGMFLCVHISVLARIST